MKSNKTVQEIVSATISVLSPISDEARLETELLLAHALGKPRIWLVSHSTNIVPQKDLTHFNNLVTQRQQHKPLAYILGGKEFYGLNFYVDENVLIPRPETEFLVDYVLNYASTDNRGSKSLRIADIGTGSGCIAITLAKHLPNAKITAIDISKQALAVAKKNAILHHVASHIAFSQGNLLEPLLSCPVDIVVANLPYIPSDTIAKLGPEVKDWEPRLALDGGSDGLDLYDILEQQITKLELKPKLALYEINYTQFANFNKRGFTVIPEKFIAIRRR